MGERERVVVSVVGQKAVGKDSQEVPSGGSHLAVRSRGPNRPGRETYTVFTVVPVAGP